MQPFLSIDPWARLFGRLTEIGPLGTWKNYLHPQKDLYSDHWFNTKLSY